jgi:hypothetical protein
MHRTSPLENWNKKNGEAMTTFTELPDSEKLIIIYRLLAKLVEQKKKSKDEK